MKARELINYIGERVKVNLSGLGNEVSNSTRKELQKVGKKLLDWMSGEGKVKRFSFHAYELSDFDVLLSVSVEGDDRLIGFLEDKQAHVRVELEIEDIFREVKKLTEVSFDKGEFFAEWEVSEFS